MITQQRSNQFTALSGQIMQPEDLKKVKWDHCHPQTCLSFQTFPCKMQAGQPTTCLALQKPMVKDKCSALASVQEAARGNSDGPCKPSQGCSWKHGKVIMDNLTDCGRNQKILGTHKEV